MFFSYMYIYSSLVEKSRVNEHANIFHCWKQDVSYFKVKFQCMCTGGKLEVSKLDHS